MLSERIELFTRSQVADQLQVSPRTVDRWIRSGDLPIVKVSNRIIRIDPEALRGFVERRKAE